jgi:F-type H+-transporting ATPase subunit epsilon
LPLGDVTKDELDRRIEAAKADLADAAGDDEKTKLEQFLNHLAAIHDDIR